MVPVRQRLGCDLKGSRACDRGPGPLGTTSFGVKNALATLSPIEKVQVFLTLEDRGPADEAYYKTIEANFQRGPFCSALGSGEGDEVFMLIQ